MRSCRCRSWCGSGTCIGRVLYETDPPRPRLRRGTTIKRFVWDLLEAGVRDDMALHRAVQREFPLKCGSLSYVIRVKLAWFESQIPDGDTVTVRLAGL